MIEHILKYLSVFVASMFKFILGPLAGASAGLTVVETWVFTALGMMATVTVITYAGTKIRERLAEKFFKKKKNHNSGKVKKINRFISKYGLFGVAFLTPVFLSPPGGAILAISFGKDKKKILLYMFVSAVCWGFVFSSVIILSGEQVLQYWNR